MATKQKKQQNRAKDTWNGISGLMHIYGNEFKNGKNTRLSWSVSLPIKNKGGEIVDNYYVPIKFTDKAEEPEEGGKHTIHINNAFFSVDSWTSKDGTENHRLVLVILDNSIEDENE